jgi:hypothetical protein
MSISRKSFSKKLSSKKSSLFKDEINSLESSIDDTKHVNPSHMILFTIIGISYNLLLIYYLNNLENASCKCIIDWRYYFIKYLAVLTILNTVLFLVYKINIFSSKNNIHLYVFALIGLINIYAFFTYIGDLQSTKCSCAVSQQKNLTEFFNIMRYLQIIIICSPIIMLIITFIMSLGK